MLAKATWLVLGTSVLILLSNAAAGQTGAPKGGQPRFVVMIDGQPAARFTSVQGLRPGKGGWITLTHGSSLNADLLSNWRHGESGKKPAASVILLALGANNNVLGRYQLVNARPKTMSLGGMKAGGNSGWLEELTITHDGLHKLN